MPRGRMLNKKISQDEKVAKLSIEATLLYTWCIPYLDFRGRIYGDVWTLKAIVPNIKELTPQRIDKCIEEWVNVGLVHYYGNEQKYLAFKGFMKNQTLREGREAESEIPTPAELQQNSGATPAQVKLSKDKLSKEKGTPAELPPESRQKFPFEEIWAQYPKKLGKKEAERHFRASVKTEQDWKDIQTALKNYLESERVAVRGVIQDGSTWFNWRWKDWLTQKEAVCPKCRNTGKYTSSTGYETICKCSAGQRVKIPEN